MRTSGLKNWALCAALAACAFVACNKEVLKITPVSKAKEPAPVASVEAKPEAPPVKTIKVAGNAKMDGDQLVVPGHVEFDTDKATLKMTNKETKEVLETVLQVMKDNPQITQLHIEGHTDNQGKHDHNMKLSQDRAEAVIAWLVKGGIEKGRLEPHGYDPDKPKDDNTKPEGRQENRRVEFHVGEIDGKPFKP
jgi:outer membrane protein OmpA-like peptidoglycan-associated protein